MQLIIRPIRTSEPLLVCDFGACGDDSSYFIELDSDVSIQQYRFCVHHLRNWISDFLESLA